MKPTYIAASVVQMLAVVALAPQVTRPSAVTSLFLREA